MKWLLIIGAAAALYFVTRVKAPAPNSFPTVGQIDIPGLTAQFADDPQVAEMPAAASASVVMQTAAPVSMLSSLLLTTAAPPSAPPSPSYGALDGNGGLQLIISAGAGGTW